MPRKPKPPRVMVEVVSSEEKDIDRSLNCLYIRMVKRQRIGSSFTPEQKKNALKALRKLHRDNA